MGTLTLSGMGATTIIEKVSLSLGKARPTFLLRQVYERKKYKRLEINTSGFCHYFLPLRSSDNIKTANDIISLQLSLNLVQG